MCVKNKNMYVWSEQAITREIATHELLLLAATVRSFVHMPLGISHRISALEHGYVCHLHLYFISLTKSLGNKTDKF